ncbi:MAG: ATP-binding protein [Eubacterium sp.]|nr:ATP-binding protein [Eubacterium sp.]
MQEFKTAATDENLNAVLGFVNEQMDTVGFSLKTQMQMEVAVEELYVNIAHYAYVPGVGDATIRVEVGEDSEKKTVSVTFIDKGIPYNPLEKEDPDVTLSAEERGIGGLGIYMVKKSMDSVEYVFKDDQNILTITKTEAI